MLLYGAYLTGHSCCTMFIFGNRYVVASVFDLISNSYYVVSLLIYSVLVLSLVLPVDHSSKLTVHQTMKNSLENKKRLYLHQCVELALT